jgi:hypothetical protein
MCPARQRPWRRGDLAEGIGLELLRRFCAVAPVPRPDDFGLDAVATLLRRAGQTLFPERSFFVTLKSAGLFERDDRSLNYPFEQWTWLQNLELPTVLGVVRLATSSMDLYGFHHLIHRLHQAQAQSNAWETVRIRLGDRDGPGSKNVKSVDSDLIVWLGEPFLSFRIERAAEPDFEDWAYAAMEAYLEAETRHMRHVDLHINEPVWWRTNEPVRPSTSWSTMINSSLEDERKEIERIHPVVRKLFARARTSGCDREAAAYKVILDRYEELRSRLERDDG